MRRSKPVRGQAGAGQAHAGQLPEAQDAAAVRGVRQDGRQRSQYRLKPPEFFLGVAGVGFVGAGEVGVRAFQHAALGQVLPDAYGLGGPRAQAVHAGVHLQVSAGVRGQQLGFLHGTHGKPHAQVSQRA